MCYQVARGFAALLCVAAAMGTTTAADLGAAPPQELPLLSMKDFECVGGLSIAIA